MGRGMQEGEWKILGNGRDVWTRAGSLDIIMLVWRCKAGEMDYPISGVRTIMGIYTGRAMLKIVSILVRLSDSYTKPGAS